MPRELKFRAWVNVPKANTMLQNIDLKDLWESGRAYEDYGTSRYEMEDINGVSWTFKDLIFMQYTGRKDKNGKEGYGDDLVKLFGRSLFRIAWDNTYARFQLELVKGEELIKVYNMDMLQYGEIVGNVYEQPELLKGRGQ